MLSYHSALGVLNTRRGQLSGAAADELTQVLAEAGNEATRLAGQVSARTCRRTSAGTSAKPQCAALNWDSAQLRHAVRCALGVLLALSLSTLWASSPLRLSFLLAVFVIMQPQPQDLYRVRTRLCLLTWELGRVRGRA